MKIGLYLSKTFTDTHTIGVYGDEIWAKALEKGLNKLPDSQAKCYGENMEYLPDTDIAIYFNPIDPNTFRPKGKKNIAIFQNFAFDGNFSHEKNVEQTRIENLLTLKERGLIDKIFTISAYYSEKYKWPLLYPAVDIDFWKPAKKDDKYKYDIIYIGNNIKDGAKTKEYLGIPGIKYGVFGNGFNYSMPTKDSMKYYTNSLLCLNYGLDTAKEIITARIFQIAACKGLVISEYLESYFNIFSDSMFWVKPGDIQSQIRQAVIVARENKKAAEDMKDRAYKIVTEKFNSDIQAKELWRFINV